MTSKPEEGITEGDVANDLNVRLLVCWRDLFRRLFPMPSFFLSAKIPPSFPHRSYPLPTPFPLVRLPNDVSCGLNARRAACEIWGSRPPPMKARPQVLLLKY